MITLTAERPGAVDTMPFNPSGFLAAVWRSDASSGSTPLDTAFQQATGLRPNLRFRTGLHDVVAVVLPDTRSERSDPDGVMLVLHGEILRDVGDPARYLLARYLAEGAKGVGSEDGSYAVLVADARSASVLVITDRWNTRRVFHCVRGGVHWLSTARTLRFQPLPQDQTVDPTGVAHYLINGLPYNGRSLFKGLCVLEKGSVHALRLEDVETRPYWGMRFTGEHEGVADDRLRGRLHDLVLAAVSRRLSRASPPWISLSGGYDSGAIFAAARVLRATDLRCFSYGNEEDEPSSDGEVARALASDLGHPHTFIAAYRRPLSQVLRDNEDGQGVVQLVRETDAWDAVATLMQTDGEPPPLLLGDEGVGCLPGPFVSTPADALASLEIRDLEAAPWLRGILDPERFALMQSALVEDRATILERVPAGLDVRDVRYWLYMDQKLSRLLGWREIFAGRWTRPRFPLLDYELIDFVSGLPAWTRVGKRLLKDMARERFPEVFERPRAKRGAGSADRWFRRQLNAEIGTFRAQLREEASPLDELLPPEALIAILDGKAQGTGSALDRVRRRIRVHLASSPRGRWLGRRLDLEQKVIMRPERFLARALFLRSFLRRRLALELGAHSAASVTT